MMVTAAEATELRERAQAARLSMGAYLRRRALGQRMRIAAEWRLGATELRELRLGAAELRELNTHLASGSGLIHRGRQGSHPLWFSCLRGVGELAGWNTRGDR